MNLTFEPLPFLERWRLVTAAASTDGRHPAMQHVLVEWYPHGVRLVATDSYVLATAWVPAREADKPEPWVEDQPDLWFTIPAHNPALEAVLRNTADDITLAFDQALNAGNLVMSSQQWTYAFGGVGQERIGLWRPLFAPANDFTQEIGVGIPMLAYFTRIAPLLAPPGTALVMRWYNKGLSKVTPLQFEITRYALRGLAMPVQP